MTTRTDLMLRVTSLPLAALLLALAWAAPAGAWEQETTNSGVPIWWPVSEATLYVHPDTWNDPSAHDAILEAEQRWNENPSWFDFTVLPDNDSVADRNNGENEIAWTDNPALLSGHPGVTLLQVDSVTGQIHETDVFLDEDEPWTSSINKVDLSAYDGSSYSAQAALIHEFGHVLGLAHEAHEYNVMGDAEHHLWVNGPTARAYVGEDAAAGACAIYGTVTFWYGYSFGTIQDLGVSHWRWDGQLGEYSRHARVRMYNALGYELNPMWENDEPRYNVNAGDTYRIEITFENNGGATVATDYDIVLSTNHYITTYDTTIYTNSIALVPNQPWTITKTVTIPSNVSGIRWIGVIIDPDDDLWEMRGDNNNTYLAKLQVN